MTYVHICTFVSLDIVLLHRGNTSVLSELLNKTEFLWYSKLIFCRQAAGD